jgi:hypothetical protein
MQPKCLYTSVKTFLALMKAILLYSGGKDSSLVAHLLKQLGYEITCVTANFGADPECVKVAGNVAKTFGYKHEVLEMPKEILEKGVDMCLEAGYGRPGINYIHHEVLEKTCEKYSKDYLVIADGCRRDDKTPKITYPETQSLEARHKIQYFCPLNGFPHATIKYLTDNLFEIEVIKAGAVPTSEYETEIRAILSARGEDPTKIFPNHHTHTIVKGYKNGST